MKIGASSLRAPYHGRPGPGIQRSRPRGGSRARDRRSLPSLLPPTARSEGAEADTVSPAVLNGLFEHPVRTRATTTNVA